MTHSEAACGVIPRNTVWRRRALTSSLGIEDDVTSTGKVDILFETAWPLSDPEGLITKFVAYESFRIKRDQYLHEMTGSLQDRLGVLLWYLSDYVRDRQGAFVVPLSAQQTAYLNSPAPLAGASPAVTIALQNFVARELPSHLNLHDPVLLREALYWWCVERAPGSKLETRLVTEDQVAALRYEEQWIGEDYPFNAFMTLFFNRHQQLHALDMNSSRDRAAFTHYLILYGFTQPHLLRFLPQETLRRVMRDQGVSNLSDRIFAKLAIADEPTAEEGRALRTRGADLLRRGGWAADGRFEENTFHSGECFERRRAFGPRIEPGIAVIGPIHKASGLGQAARLSYDVLAQVEQTKPTVRGFDLDNPAPVLEGQTQHEPYAGPRAINLIHLNAESIPLVFAYESRDIFESSYNIGFFFWELNQIPKCHRLALELLDEIWVASDYNREIYGRLTEKPVVNVGMAVEPLRELKPCARVFLGLDPARFVFIATFDSFSFIERKNPLGVLEAFAAAFPLGTEPVQLVLKTQNRGRVFDPYQIALWKRIDRVIRGDRRIIIVNETLDYRDLLVLKANCDCYISLHRSEGWGFGMIEAMQLGLPVIATAYSGNLEFCNDETAYLVDYDLVSVREDEYIFVERGSVWAQPNIETAASHMRAVAGDPWAAKMKGEAAANYVKANFSLRAIGQRYAARLAQLRPSLAQ